MATKMSALQQRISWVYFLLPGSLLVALLYVIASFATVSAKDASQIASKLEHGYVAVGKVAGAYAPNVIGVLGKEGIRTVCSRQHRGDVDVLVPEEDVEDALRVIASYAPEWRFTPQ